MGLKGSGPYFQRSMPNTVLARLVYHICDLYMYDVLFHGRDIESVIANVFRETVGVQHSCTKKEYYGIYYGVRLFEDHKNLTYLNVTLTGRILRWKLYLQDKDFYLCHVPGTEVHQGVPASKARSSASAGQSSDPGCPSTEAVDTRQGL
jgi:hypothetical protein